MIEGLSQVLTPPRSEPYEGDDTLERVAIAGANAIQRLIADRDTFAVVRMHNSKT